MDAKLEKALKRLKCILPLQERQAECRRQIRELHQHVLRSFVTQGRILTREEMAQRISNLEDAINMLRESELMVFSEEGLPVGAYPFTIEVREHKVRINGHQVYAMCALDALAISPMFGIHAHIFSRCRITGDPVNIQQTGRIIENPNEAGDVHLGIAWGAEETDACCANSLCMEMMYLRDSNIAWQWLEADLENREIFTLPEAVEFASEFFIPLTR